MMNAFNSTSVFNKQEGFTLLEILIAISLLAFITLGVVDITENAAQTKERTTQINANNLQIETAMSRFEWDFSQIYSPLYFSTVLQMGNSNPNGNDPNISTTGVTPQANTNQSLGPYAQQYFEQVLQRFQQNDHFKAISKEGIPIPRYHAPEKSEFEFFTSGNRRKFENQKQSHYAWVKYTLADQEESDSTSETEKKSDKIPKNLKSFVRYFSNQDPWGPRKINSEETKASVLLRNVESLEFFYWDLQKRKWETPYE